MSNVYIKSNQLFKQFEFESVYRSVSRPFLVADGIRNPENAGALIRLADNIGAAEVLFINGNQTVSQSRLKRAAASSLNNIAWSFIDEGELAGRLPADFDWVAIETTQKAKNLFRIGLPDKIVFFVGNESQGIRQNLIEKMQQCVYIPVPGPTRSLNVSHAASVAMFEWLRQKMLTYYF